MYAGAYLAQILTELLRPHTQPLAVRHPRPGEDFPKRVHRPAKLLKHRVTTCQAITMARRYGWKLGLQRDDVCCAAALVAYGWVEEEPTLDEVADLMLAAQYAENPEAARRQIAAIPRLPNGECTGLVISPLEVTTSESDLLMIYGNAAQMMRLVQAATYHESRSLSCSFGGRAASCAEGIVRAAQTRHCQLVLPGGGDRIFAMTADGELAFTPPMEMMDHLMGSENVGSPGRPGRPYPSLPGVRAPFSPDIQQALRQDHADGESRFVTRSS